MPVSIRKWLLYAAKHGLVLYPSGINHPDHDGIYIEYGSLNIASAERNDNDRHHSSSIEIYGVVGLLNLVSSAYLIVITRREEVAQIQGKAVYAVRDVVLVPLKSQSEAEQTITSSLATLKQNADYHHDSETDVTDEETENAETHNIKDGDKPPEAQAVEPPKGVLKRSTSVAKDVIQDRGKYGRFAASWLAKAGSNLSTRRKQGISSVEDLDSQPLGPKALGGDDASNAARGVSAIETLSRRIQRTARLYFSSGGFYFSYDFNLSRSFGEKIEDHHETPIYKHFNSKYLWNRSLLSPFIEAGQDNAVLPLLQGFVGQRAVSILKTPGEGQDSIANTSENQGSATEPPRIPDAEQSQEFLLTLISRRSIKRAGLRYLRRGVDDDGNVANAVETEQILSNRDFSDSTYSLLQIRGSIPLHFKQSPYSFKPTPIIVVSEATNQKAMRKHFDQLIEHYGSIQAVSLVDKHGPEKSIGQLYESEIKTVNDSCSTHQDLVQFEWFDFHNACKGMTFENVSILMTSLGSTLKSFGWTERQDDRVLKSQSGVVRTNCMDCLDRTNVVQSAIASWALEQQLAELGFKIDLKKDPKTQWFNSLWADNGDAISKQYAGTAALKGDFTRTRKRNWTGALSDFSLTLNRYYNNIFGDYFVQTCIDYFLGNAGPGVFDEFETDMMSKDYALDMSRIRQNAIDTCVKIVLEDAEEDLVDGWTLSCPRQANTLRTLPFEECVVLLTNVALYFCRFDWTTEKVTGFEKVILTDIREIWRGAYVTNAFGNNNLDAAKNVGFALRYKPVENLLVRRNTRTLSMDDSEESNEKPLEQAAPKQEETNDDQARLLAFKALPAHSSGIKQEGSNGMNMSEVELIEHICNEIQRAVNVSRREEQDGHTDQQLKVVKKDIISAADAKKSTGYAESLGYSLKKLVWS